MLRRILVPCLIGLAMASGFIGCKGPQTLPTGTYPEPEQIKLGGADPIPMLEGRYSIKPRATYQIHAFVMSRENYRMASLGDLVPLDLALAWGQAATPEVQQAIEVSQRNRWYFWRAKSQQAWAGLPKDIGVSMANVHIIAADRWIARELDAIEPGDTVELRGKLVDIYQHGQLIRATSLTRDDQGAGACEILLVDRVMRKRSTS
jgi:hypothetical protein